MSWLVEHVLKQFDDLTKCPLVVADEHLPSEWTSVRKSTASSELRVLIGSSSRTLKRKFLPNTSLRGAIRIMLLSNDKNMLPFDEELGQQDLDAIAGRFLHIKTRPEAAEFLKHLGGQTGRMRNWIEGDEIAAHALWLCEQRPVAEGGRFIVEGEPSDMHTNLIIGTKIGGLICEAFIKLLSGNSKTLGTPPAIRYGDGRLLASTAGIAREWELIVRSDRVYTPQRIGRQLKLMSSAMENIGGQPYHVIRHEYVLQWAEEYNFGDPQAMRAKINGNAPIATIIDLDTARKGKKDDSDN